MKSSFVRKPKNTLDAPEIVSSGSSNLGLPPAPILPSGTKPSVHNGQLLISTGLHELDGKYF
jgi:hypothetical protein